MLFAEIAQGYMFVCLCAPPPVISAESQQTKNKNK